RLRGGKSAVSRRTEARQGRHARGQALSQIHDADERPAALRDVRQSRQHRSFGDLRRAAGAHSFAAEPRRSLRPDRSVKRPIRPQGTNMSDIIDIHPHIVSPDTKRYPLAPLGGKQSAWSSERPTTYQQLLQAMDEAGVAKAAIVHSST